MIDSWLIYFKSLSCIWNTHVFTKCQIFERRGFKKVQSRCLQFFLFRDTSQAGIDFNLCIHMKTSLRVIVMIRYRGCETAKGLVVREKMSPPAEFSVLGAVRPHQMLQLLRWQDHAAVTLLVLKQRGRSLSESYWVCRKNNFRGSVFILHRLISARFRQSDGCLCVWSRSKGVFLRQGRLAPHRAVPQKPPAWPCPACNWVD